MTKQNQELSELFGVPEEGLETGRHVHPENNQILNNGQPTGYHIGGEYGWDIINPRGERIGIVNGETGRIYNLAGRDTGYSKGGKTGYNIIRRR